MRRQTGRHAAEGRTRPWLRRTKDGRYVKAFLFWGGRDVRVITEMLNEAGIEHDLESESYRELHRRSPSEAQTHFSAMIDKLVASMTAEEVFHRAQAKGLLWASVRRPEENIEDPHFQARGTFQPIHHPELLGEHTQEVLSQAGLAAADIASLAAQGAL